MERNSGYLKLVPDSGKYIPHEDLSELIEIARKFAKRDDAATIQVSIQTATGPAGERTLEITAGEGLSVSIPLL